MRLLPQGIKSRKSREKGQEKNQEKGQEKSGMGNSKFSSHAAFFVLL